MDDVTRIGLTTIGEIRESLKKLNQPIFFLLSYYGCFAWGIDMI